MAKYLYKLTSLMKEMLKRLHMIQIDTVLLSMKSNRQRKCVGGLLSTKVSHHVNLVLWVSHLTAFRLIRLLTGINQTSQLVR